ncbi:RidA family protein [Cupriavidus sp. 2TAF22]|uniref:RidA family protein n=1 Tax=unclassified Cupriavidus TaxID=2640874 RepID=UPI003F92BD73
MTTLTPEARLAAAGHVLPPAPQPRGAYAPFNVAGDWIGISGQTSRRDGVAMAGMCRADADVEPARQAAQVAMLNALAALRAACGGGLERVVQVTRLRGFIRSGTDFTRHTAVLDAASDVLSHAFPEHALPARTAVGVASLPDQAWIEIELEARLSPAASHSPSSEPRSSRVR